MEHQEKIYGYSYNRRIEDSKYDDKGDTYILEQYL